MKIIKEWKCFGGTQRVYRHASTSTGTDMEFAVFEPPGEGPRPVLYFLSGLTCTWENVVTKGGFQVWASQLGVTVVCPDTSPRGEGVADDPEASDLGMGAGFYVDATEQPWASHYRMKTYVTEELPRLIEPELNGFSGRRGLFGHSMGGHGALTLGMSFPDFYSSVSAFSPVVAPSLVPWGQKAFSHYLGQESKAWAEADACALVQSRGCPHPLLIDVGDSDPFLERELRPELFESACQKAGVKLTLRRQPGYDHSYYFISTFMQDHIQWHAERLTGSTAEG